MKRTSLKRSILGLALSLACCALPTGCTTFEGHTAVVPFFEVFQDPQDLPKDKLDPFTSTPEVQSFPPPRDSRPPTGKDYVLRPFGSYADYGPDRWQLKVLWPVADFKKVSGEVRQWVFPVWYRQKKRDLTGGVNDRWMLFPFLAGGQVAEHGSYFAFFPFAGKVRGFLGEEEIDFYVFPGYARVHNKGADSLHVLWPFYNQIEGGGKSGWRIWPFYGHYQWETEDRRPRYDRMFCMWPFYMHQRNELNTLHPSRLFFIFPFYGENESDRTFTRTILWPFFNSTLDKRTGKKLLFGFLLPYRFHEGQFDLWPFFGVKHYEFREVIPTGVGAENYRQFILWPIERYTREEDQKFLSTRFWLIPFYWRFHDLRKEDQAEDLEWKLWPLASYQKRVNDKSFFFPALWPFHQEVPLERLYARLWRLFLYRDTPTLGGWEALFALLSYRHEKVPDVRTFSILGGLFERRSSPEGTGYRFFYLPWR